jgi:hypothetical protein
VQITNPLAFKADIEAAWLHQVGLFYEGNQKSMARVRLNAVHVGPQHGRFVYEVLDDLGPHKVGRKLELGGKWEVLEASRKMLAGSALIGGGGGGGGGSEWWTGSSNPS